MVTDLTVIRAVSARPAVRNLCGIYKIEYPRADGISFKAHLGGNDAVRRRRSVYRSVCRRSELNSEASVENNPVDSIREFL